MTTPTQGSSEWKEVDATDTCPGYLTFKHRIQVSEIDDRCYRLIKLQNGLTALLVHDPCADKAAACVAVSVGHLQDPVGPYTGLVVRSQ